MERQPVNLWRTELQAEQVRGVPNFHDGGARKLTVDRDRRAGEFHGEPKRISSHSMLQRAPDT
jgi:hypothetical protein